MDELKTKDEWSQLELDVNRSFSAGPLLPVSSDDLGPSEQLYPGRASEVQRMMEAVRDPAKHIVLYGERGIGKTSLSNTFWRSPSAFNRPAFAARVQVYPSDDFSSLWTRALAEFRTVAQRYSREIRFEVGQNFDHIT